MIILDGKKLSNKIADRLKRQISKFPNKPCLGIIQVGDNRASNLYIQNKIKFGEKIGAKVKLFKLEKNIEQNQIINLINKINKDKNIHGVIVQMPLPNKIKTQQIFDQINPDKDVDGLSAINLGSLFRGDESRLMPATAKGIFSILKEYKINVSAKKVLVIGRSVLVGKSVAMKLLNHDATVTICHSKTKNLSDEIKKAEIVVVAVGRKNFITDRDIFDGQIIIDVGINSTDDSLVGDTNIKNKQKLEAFSPVPGGVGPMTVASLFENLIETYKKQNNL